MCLGECNYLFGLRVQFFVWFVQSGDEGIFVPLKLELGQSNKMMIVAPFSLHFEMGKSNVGGPFSN